MPVFFSIPLVRKERDDSSRDFVCYGDYPIAELFPYTDGELNGWRSDLAFVQGYHPFRREYLWGGRILPLLGRDGRKEDIFLIIKRQYYHGKPESDCVIEPFRQFVPVFDIIRGLSTEDGDFCDIVTLKVKIYDIICIHKPDGYELFLILKDGVTVLKTAIFGDLYGLVAELLPEREHWRLISLEDEGFGKDRWKKIDFYD